MQISEKKSSENIQNKFQENMRINFRKNLGKSSEKIQRNFRKKFTINFRKLLGKSLENSSEKFQKKVYKLSRQISVKSPASFFFHISERLQRNFSCNFLKFSKFSHQLLSQNSLIFPEFLKT